jgi:hypothetical protein
MPRKKVIKEPIEKVKDKQVVLEIIEDSSDEEALPPPPEDNAIRVSKGNEVISQMSVDDIKQELKTPKPRVKRVLTEEQKAKMKAGREKKKAEKALQAGKAEKNVAPIITTNLTPPPVEEPPVPKEEQMPGWFKAYMASQKKVEPEAVKTAPVKKGRGRPAGAKDSKPRAKPKKQSTVSPEPEEVVLPPPKTSMRFI